MNITNKPQVQDGNFVKLFHKTNRFGKSSITASAVESWNKIKKELKNTLLQHLSPNKLKQCSIVFILNHLNNFDRYYKNGYDFNSS